MLRDLQDALKLSTENLHAVHVHMPLLDPKARCFQVAEGVSRPTLLEAVSPKFCAGLVLPGDDDTVLAELLVTMEGSEVMNSEWCSEYADAENPSGKMTRDVIVWMKDTVAGSTSTLCTMSFGDIMVDPDCGWERSLANATISFSKTGMRQLKQLLQIDETTSDYALVRLWLSAVACSNQHPPDVASFVATGTEGKLSFQLDTLQAFMDATTEGGSRRAHEAAMSGQRSWWSLISWAESIAQYWGAGNAVNNQTRVYI